MHKRSTQDLVAVVRSLHLVTPEQLAKLAALSQASDEKTFADESVHQGILTAFQANALFQGRGEELVLGPYVLIERIGAGGMGEVYKAKNRTMGRIVALKVIRRDQLQNETAVGRFQREVRAASQLSHANIVVAFDAGQQGNTHYFAMEYVDGIDLSQKVKKEGALAVADACEFIRQAALGLQHAHERGMVHRDIKPSNLLVACGTGGQAVVKILDMGLARMVATDDSIGTLTQEGAILGTLDYLSPEQAVNARQADIRSDLYSLGCTFYFLLTGQPPFPGGTATEKLLKHRFDEPAPVEQLRRHVPVLVAAIVRRMIAKEPALRFQTPAEVAALLVGGPQHIPTFDLAGTAVRHRRFGIGRFGRTRIWIGGALLALFAIVMVARLLSWHASNSPISPTTGPVQSSQPSLDLRYVKKDTREGTILATLQANRLPTLEGKWYAQGPLPRGEGMPLNRDTPPVQFNRSSTGISGNQLNWKECAVFPIGKQFSTSDLIPDEANQSLSCFYHEFSVERTIDMVIAAGSDVGIAIWLNDERIIVDASAGRPKPEPIKLATMFCKPGKNTLMIGVFSFTKGSTLM